MCVFLLKCFSLVAPEVRLFVPQTVDEAKKKINQLIVAEQARRTITDPYIRQLSQAHMDELNQLQRRLTVRISLERGQEEDETKIHLEGLTRDVASAEGKIRSATSNLLPDH